MAEVTKQMAALTQYEKFRLKNSPYAKGADEQADLSNLNVTIQVT
jgi:hypothetical protein